MKKMNKILELIKPKCVPPLDPDFRPAVLANQAFLEALARHGSWEPVVIGLERSDGMLSRFETRVFPEPCQANNDYVERLVKALLWKHGAWKLFIGGPKSLGQYIGECYQEGGTREFDAHFFGEKIYKKSFTVVSCESHEVPPENEEESSYGRNLKGCRIGIDLGASDRKVSAVVDGEAIYSEEVVWEPKIQKDPNYHYNEVLTAIKTAASKMPHLDTIGCSSAGIYINNRPRAASLFRGISEEDFPTIEEMFLKIGKELNVPIVAINDGDVTALAGAMSLGVNGILGIALGSSEAAGYVNPKGNITGWINELAFMPIDYNLKAPVDEWSGDSGVGASYLSQQCVFRLASEVGIQIPQNITDAEKLKLVQNKLEYNDAGAKQIWRSMGYYMGYAIAHYRMFYDFQHVLILGRCTSGKGGQLLLDGAKEVLNTEFPVLAAEINVSLPDEKSRRVGQSIAAASLPSLEQTYS